MLIHDSVRPEYRKPYLESRTKTVNVSAATHFSGLATLPTVTNFCQRSIEHGVRRRMAAGCYLPAVG